MKQLRAHAVRVVDVAPLVTHLDDADRCLPVVIVSAGKGQPKYAFAPNRLAERLEGRATVWMLDSPAVSWQLRDARRQYATYGGAVRVVDRHGRGPVIRTDVDPDQVLDRIVTTVETMTSRGTPATTTVVDDTGRVEELRSMLADRERELVRLRGELAAARRALDRPKTPVAVDKPVLEPARAWQEPVYSDPERQLRYEIEQTWLHHLPEADREQWPLRDYTIGPRFLESLATPLASRQRIIDVVVDVLTRRAYTLASRAVSAQRLRRHQVPPRRHGLPRLRATPHAWRAAAAVVGMRRQRGRGAGLGRPPRRPHPSSRISCVGRDPQPPMGR